MFDPDRLINPEDSRSSTGSGGQSKVEKCEKGEREGGRVATRR